MKVETRNQREWRGPNPTKPKTTATT